MKNLSIIRTYLVKILLIIPFIFTVACSHNAFNYAAKPTPIVKGETKYYISSVNVKFKPDNSLDFLKSDFSSYPNEKQLGEVIKEIFKNKLKEQGIYSDNPNDKKTLTLRMNVSYKRIGILWSKTGYYNLVMSHVIDILKNDELIAYSNLDDYTIYAGFWKEQGRPLSAIFQKRGPNRELEDLNIAIKSLAKDLKNLGIEIQ